MAWITNSVSTRLSQMTLKQVAGRVGPDGEHLRRVSVGFEVHDDDRVLDRVKNGLLAVAVLGRRSVEPHTWLS